MKKLIVTLGLAAAVVSSLFAGSPARAADEAPQLMPEASVPSSLVLKPIVPLGPQYLTLLPRAELISRVTVTPYAGNPLYRLVYCKVSNIGHRNTGPFKTLVRIHRKLAWFLPVTTAQATVPIWNIAPGGHQWIVLKAFAPLGISKAFSFADSTFVVPEYVESNNFDFWP
jgi:hypothetical protein